MKALLHIFFVFSAFSISAQTVNPYGIYRGVCGNDLVIIDIMFELNNDNTFTITQKHTFSKPLGCQSGIIKQKGNWIYKKGWIYFKPDTIFTRGDISLYVNFKEENKNKRMIKQMNQKGYNIYLKPIIDNKKVTKICFHISDDCYESLWDYDCVTKND